MTKGKFARPGLCGALGLLMLTPEPTCASPDLLYTSNSIILSRTRSFLLKTIGFKMTPSAKDEGRAKKGMKGACIFS